jgi:hypothetical protein
MNNYSLSTVVKDYEIINGFVVKITKKNTVAFWNAQTMEVLATENAKNEVVFRRKLASGFIKMLDPKMTKKVNANFGRNELMDRLVSMVDIAELASYSKTYWGIFLLQWYSEPQTGVGFDLVSGTATSINEPTGHIQLVFNSNIQGKQRFMLLCEATANRSADVMSPTPVRVTLTYAHLNYDDPVSITPNCKLSNPMMLEVDNDGQGFVIETGSDEVGLPIGEPDSFTYLIARIECLKLDAKGKYKSLEKGKFDSLQIVGIRFPFINSESQEHQ